jgi:hypothetical protein
MPNLCNNEIQIKFANEEDAARFMRKVNVSGEGSIARAFRPMPAILDGTQSPTPEGEFDPNGRFQAFVDDPTNHHWDAEVYEEHKEDHYKKVRRCNEAFAETNFYNWYDWASARWGTKWGDYDVELDKHNEFVTGHYATAWGPLCEDFWEYVSTCYPDAQILVTYDEPGMGFEGAASFYNGQCVYSEEQDRSDLANRAEYALDEAAAG